MNQQKDIIRDARVLGTPKMLLLGLQHMFAMFGATILVPILVNSYFQSTSQVLSVQVTLFCAGFGTLFFHLCTKFKVPAFVFSTLAGAFFIISFLLKFFKKIIHQIFLDFWNLIQFHKPISSSHKFSNKKTEISLGSYYLINF